MKLSDEKTWIGRLLDRRQLVPRWRSPYQAAQSGERGERRREKADGSVASGWIKELQERAASDASVGHEEVELAESLFVCNGKYDWLDSNSNQALRKLRVSWNQACNLSDAGESPQDGEVGVGVRDLHSWRLSRYRQMLAIDPRQPFVWSEVARSHLILGQDAKSERAMKCALQMAPSNSYLKRAASRMYLHFHEPLAALQLLRAGGGIRRSPWLIAADIACSSSMGKTSPFAGLGMKLVGEADFSPLAMGDLTAALGTLELENGKHKSARSLFQKAAIDPTENALAQLQWARERESSIDIPDRVWRTPNAYEAQAAEARLAVDWDSVLDFSEQWLMDQVFSSKPAIIGSFATFNLDQCRRAKILATAAIEISGDKRLLRNNRAVAGAYLGEFESSLRDVNAAKELEGDRQDPYLCATSGLLAYRCGAEELGERNYLAAISYFAGRGEHSSAALATLFYLREKLRWQFAEALQIFEVVRHRFMGPKFRAAAPEINAMIKAIESDIDEVSSHMFLEEAVPEADLDLVRRAADMWLIQPSSKSIQQLIA